MATSKDQPPLRFRTRVRRTGNSLAVVIPAEHAQRIGLGPDRDVEVTIDPKPPSALGLLQRLGATEQQIEEIGAGWREHKRTLYPDG